MNYSHDIRQGAVGRASTRRRGSPLLAPLAMAAGLLFSAAAPIESAAAKSYAQLVREANDKTVTIVAGAPGDTSLDLANDLATVLHCVDGLRIVPMVGRGDANNIYDLLFLRGVDMAIVRADVLDYLAETDSYVSDMKRRVLYIAPLFEQEVHLIASEGINSVQDLQGKLVNIGATGTLALEAKRILEAAGVTVISSKFDNELALERVVDGSLDAMFITGGKPLPLLDQLDGVTGLRLVPIEPLAQPVYNEAVLAHEDYPSLVPASVGAIPTVSIPSVLAVYNWPEDTPRFAKNQLFTEALYRRANYLQRPARHPKWSISALAGSISGWERFAPAADIAATFAKPAAEEPVETSSAGDFLGPSDAELMALFEAKLLEYGLVPRSEAERQQLFLAFKRTLAAVQGE